MDKSEFVKRLEENRLENINVIRLDSIDSNGCRGGVFEVSHIACKHTDEIALRHGVSETLLNDCVKSYCKSCRRKIERAADFAKKYIECIYVDAVDSTQKANKLEIVSRIEYLRIFRNDLNLHRFAEMHFTESEIEFMHSVDEYIAKNILSERTENGKRIILCKVDNLKNRLTHFRSFYRMSRKELSELTGISFKTIENYELGRTKLSSISIENAVKIADVLDIRTEFFV